MRRLGRPAGQRLQALPCQIRGRGELRQGMPRGGAVQSILAREGKVRRRTPTTCWLQSAVPNEISNACCISGVKR